MHSLIREKLPKKLLFLGTQTIFFFSKIGRGIRSLLFEKMSQLLGKQLKIRRVTVNSSQKIDTDSVAAYRVNQLTIQTPIQHCFKIA